MPQQTHTSRTPEAPILALRGVSRSFGSQQVLRDITFDVRRGETLAVIGESGCGKSVTLKLMMGLLNPSAGDVLWNGNPISNRTERELHRDRLKIGFLFQGAALFDSMDVYENVAFGLRQNKRLPEAEIESIVVEHLRESGLSPSIARKMPSELSGGMRKRVGLARALALSPEVMLYDEPTTGLDPVMSDVINELILRTRDRRAVTGIVVTHDMTTLRKVPDRIVMLYPQSRLQPNEPQIVYEGSPAEIFDAEDSRVRQFVRGEAGERIEELFAA